MGSSRLDDRSHLLLQVTPSVGHLQKHTTGSPQLQGGRPIANPPPHNGAKLYRTQVLAPCASLSTSFSIHLLEKALFFFLVLEMIFFVPVFIENFCIGTMLFFVISQMIMTQKVVAVEGL